jgi:hypothetical protein
MKVGVCVCVLEADLRNRYMPISWQRLMHQAMVYAKCDTYVVPLSPKQPPV